ncbi:L-aspartate oxidase [Candidatus Peregrinibacteria bacterium CG22_combo_CG10-13_8_21_14_all_44_10]|nr:MAG: hypothetical protein AUK45_00240 [Candidatus Peregrinibacteria bacterium CG2_30_44_17]PIP66363.1 MAG: L-aspartate oxidase [Candidatus Peregrinibacteria bacterium CG22_combo_CG10-13_8_21_14_all_44_10]PIS04139.1 MAG: L-aspartate oxidase [Candidatus Peregrinibacteria bacterium CG10_big_fil_rev_8_21_14_0_10_44_7]PIX79217.1 MAG: L-aspartate oxidase [Candidatus Peregrinibacteria bacterium CG_4_10_14_3_um_filter_44_21]PJB89531.1 MAG: L-aspartate oxidase [Candidatus Peregrinibacteria bacterium 
MKSESRSVKFLVIGSGAAGLNFAITASQYGEVLLITKKKISDSATEMAQGGVAAVTSKKDSVGKHIEDTLKAGHYTNKKSAVKYIIEKGPAVIRHLASIGVNFDKTLHREGGHSERRISHVGDHTGDAIEKALIKQVRKIKNIHILEHTRATKLTKKNGKITGCHAICEQKNCTLRIAAKATILATGGIGRKFQATTNPEVSTGDGIDMSKAVGAKLMDMKYIQFHPTALSAPGKPTFLLTEALRGEGARIIDENGARFIDELAPRDIVCSAINKKRNSGHKVFLDFTHKDKAKTKATFSHVYSTLKKYGFDLTKEPIPIEPAAHYLCGGIATDICGRTSLPGLYAYGETARTGLHGANRLASNSLLEAIATTMDMPKELRTL